MWSDESKFEVISTRNKFVRHPRGVSRYGKRYCNRTVKWPDSVMVWGAFSGNDGRAGLAFLKQGVTMNGPIYLDVLKKHLPTFMDLHDCDIFMQDGAPCHHSKLVTEWLQEQNYQVLKWPGNSPDLNPIKNCWKIIKDKVVRLGQNTSVATLIKFIKLV